MRQMSKRAAAITATAAVAIGGVGAAAYASGWLSGTGSASASTAAIKPVTAEATVEGNLYPGVTRHLNASVTNPNEFAVSITDLSEPKLTITKANGDANPACDAVKAKIRVTPITPTRIEAESTGQSVKFWNAVTMDRAADAACAGSKFTLAFKLVGDVA
jgi:hypothetical protein